MALTRASRRGNRLAFPTVGDIENRMRRFIEGTDIGLFDDTFATDALGWMPATEIAESNGEIVVTAELPGIDRKNIDVAIDEGVLTIRGEKSAERKEEDEKCYLSERTYGAFERSFALPRSIDASKISADFSNGVLKVRIPKTADGKAKSHKIEIGGAK